MHETCSVCGRVADARVEGDPPLTWSVERDASGAADGPPRWVCAHCTRDNLRAIEAKLDQEWW